MKKNIYTILLLVTVMFIAGCGKYEEGPKISFLSKTKRFCKEWKFTQVTFLATGSDITSNYANETWKFDDDGTFSRLYSGTVAVTGTWEFSGDVDMITNMSNIQTTIEILRLKNKELWLNDGINEYRMEPN